MSRARRRASKIARSFSYSARVDPSPFTPDGIPVVFEPAYFPPLPEYLHHFGLLTTCGTIPANSLLILPFEIIKRVIFFFNPSTLDTSCHVNRKLRTFALREMCSRLLCEIAVGVPCRWWETRGGHSQLRRIYHSRFPHRDMRFACRVCCATARPLVYPFEPPGEKSDSFLCDSCWATHPDYKIIHQSKVVETFGLCPSDLPLIPWYDLPRFQNYQKGKYVLEREVRDFVAARYDADAQRLEGGAEAA